MAIRWYVGPLRVLEWPPEWRVEEVRTGRHLGAADSMQEAESMADSLRSALGSDPVGTRPAADNVDRRGRGRLAVVPSDLNLLEALALQLHIGRAAAHAGWPDAALTEVPPHADLFSLSIGGGDVLLARWRLSDHSTVWRVWQPPDGWSTVDVRRG